MKKSGKIKSEIKKRGSITPETLFDKLDEDIKVKVITNMRNFISKYENFEVEL